MNAFMNWTNKEIKENFEIHEKSMPLSLKRGKGDNIFVSLEKEFGTNRGDLFEKWNGSNVRMANEESFQKLLVCTDTRVKNHKPGASIVNAKLLDKLVKKEITKTNYKKYKQKLKNQIDNFDFYKISQYCNELVSDMKGGQEPRMLCNLLINSREEFY